MNQNVYISLNNCYSNMSQKMPQEIEVWYLIPALRRELATVFIKEHGLKQKEIADILGITEAAVSQYLKAKRGTDVKFLPKESEAIKKAAKNILSDKENMMKYLYDISKSFSGSKTLCALHRRHDSKVPVKCSVCSQIS